MKDWNEIHRLSEQAKRQSQDETGAGVGVAIGGVVIGLALASGGGEAVFAIACVVGVFAVAIAGLAAIMNTERNFAERDRLMYDKPEEPPAKQFDMTVLYKRYPALPGAERARKSAGDGKEGV